MRKPLRKAKASARGIACALYRLPNNFAALATQTPSLIRPLRNSPSENRNDHYCSSTPPDGKHTPTQTTDPATTHGAQPKAEPPYST